MGITYNPRIVTDGLVLCLDAANAKSYPGSGTTWTDLSGRGNNGTLVNSVGYNSGNLGSLVFDGVDDYATLTNNNNSLAPNILTIEAWVRHTNPSQSVSFVGGYGDTGFQGYWLGKSASNWTFSIGVGGTFRQLGGDTYQSNVIQHLVGTYDSTTMSFYTNGVLKTTATSVSGNISYSGVTPYVGNVTSLNANRYWTGNIYMYKIYNRALSASEVQQNFNATRGRFGI